VQERHGHTGGNPEKITDGLKHLTYSERQRELRLVSLEKGRFRESPITLWEGVKKTKSDSSQ